MVLLRVEIKSKRAECVRFYSDHVDELVLQFVQVPVKIDCTKQTI